MTMMEPKYIGGTGGGAGGASTGVASINGLTGTISLAGTGVSIVASGQTITFGVPASSGTGSVITAWAAYSATMWGFGSGASPAIINYLRSRKVGENIEVMFDFASGAVQSTLMQISIGVSGVNTNGQSFLIAPWVGTTYGLVGRWMRASGNNTNVGAQGSILGISGSPTVFFAYNATNNNPGVPAPSSTNINMNEHISGHFSVPIGDFTP